MTQTAQDVAYLVAFSHVRGIGPRRLADLERRFGSVRSAWQAPASELAEVLDRRSLAALLKARADLDAARAMDRVAASGAQAIAIGDERYPPRLASVAGAPFVLYVRGDEELLASPCVAIVGTRRASDYGRRAARWLAGELASAGLTIVSGLAYGIDAEAHQAALDSTGHTIAVLGNGVDIAYPRQHRSLMATIAGRGAIISPFPPGTTPLPGNFPARNRIVSGMSQATIVVEAGQRSGALVTASQAMAAGRPVFAVPGSIFSDGHIGANRLLGSGAHAATSAADVLAQLGMPAVEPVRAGPSPAATDPLESAILSELGPEPVHIDSISRRTGRPSADVARALSILEVKGIVRCLGGTQWVANP